MVFLEILKELVEGVKGAQAATVMGMDGFSVQKYPDNPVGYDVDNVAVEYGKVISEIKNAASILSLGEMEELTVTLQGLKVMLRMVTPDYYIAFMVGSGANAGKAKYLLRKAAVKARKELTA